MSSPLNPISQAQEAINSLSNTYLDWTRSQLKDMFNLIERYEDGQKSFNAAILEQLFDLSHNIKGMGGSFGYHLMTDVGGSLCSYLHRIEQPEAASFNVINAHIKAMDLIVSDDITGSGGHAGQKLLSQLHNMIEKSLTAA
ncbi:Hpt domain-containing protein [Emcibacter sp.]|uniref:Hpt domain-containing protein n=1 Tax=Emcibacter sp. TaxID=1979954 RepID=UPI002AA772DE|nr:Hpt domain-containing protein [Emcibacter sp.]